MQWHRDNDIHVTAYFPLANLNPIYEAPDKSKITPPSLLENEDITKIAKERGCTKAQVALKWGMDRETSVIPKSSHADRIRENFASLDCVLEEEDYAVIKEIGQKYVKRFNNPNKAWEVPLNEGLDGV